MNYKEAEQLLYCMCQETKKGLLYINVCGWKRVPTPADENKPVPVCGGRLETDTDEGGGTKRTVVLQNTNLYFCIITCIVTCITRGAGKKS